MACAEMFYAAQALERFNMPIMEFLSLTPFIQGAYRAVINTQIEHEKKRQAEYEEMKNKRGE